MLRWGLAILLLCLSATAFGEVVSNVSITGNSAKITSSSDVAIGTDVELVGKFEEALKSMALFRGVKKIQAKADMVIDDGFGYVTKTSYYHFFVGMKHYSSVPPMLVDVQEVEGSYTDSTGTSSYRTLTVSGPLATYGGATPYQSAEKLLNHTFSLTWSISPDPMGTGNSQLVGLFYIHSPNFETSIHQVLSNYFGNRAELVTQQQMLVVAGRFVRSINERILQ